MHSRWTTRLTGLAAACVTVLAVLASSPARASTAYGDLNNFDVFNDTGSSCHGFEIELEDLHSTDLTYTYDYNHYGAPTITEDTSNPLHPRVIVRHAARYDAATNTFSAYTAVPAAPPAATDGHQCTNPSVNIGCEHFGVGHYGNPTAVRYFWLIEDPTTPGTLIRGPAVNVATPSWTYYPVAPNQPVAQVQAVIQAPPPPPEPVYEFGDAVWVKCIVTTSHNNQVVELRDLVSDDPDDANDENWTNGEPDEVEVEWRIMQTEFNNPDGANNDLAGENEDLPNGDEVITRRYEFYKYAGPLDPETNEAKCDNYPQIADPADPSYKAECDPATVVVLGDYIGAQMAGFNVEAVLGLIDHIQDGEIGQPFTTRTIVVGGNTPYLTTVGPGSLPPGLSIDSATGVLSGTPTLAGEFSFTIVATDADAVQVSKAYTARIVDTADTCPADPAKTEPGVCGCGVSDVDGDADGTADCNDQCPADAAKTEPGVCGCGVSDVDGDADGTADCNDQCPADAAKTEPGVCGCGVSDADGDADGTADCNDQCPADAAKTAPGVCGCGVSDADGDADGTADCTDQCPADAAKTEPGVCGCGVSDADGDADGTADCNDQCPADAAKTAPGVCGCGVSDADGDADGTADCNDQCPADAAKTAPGVCGCGVSDVDGDADGTADCNDQCPADAAKTAPGVCGCGVSDADGDADGTADCNDQCPADAAKTAPGVCGCGVSDADGNGDGVVDCLEGGADLSLAMQAAPRLVSRKHPLEVRVRVRNKGPESARSVTTEVACSGVPYRIVEASEGCDVTVGGAPVLSCTAPLLRSGKAVEAEFRIVPGAAGTLICTATTSSVTPDPNPTNQSRTVTARVR